MAVTEPAIEPAEGAVRAADTEGLRAYVAGINRRADAVDTGTLERAIEDRLRMACHATLVRANREHRSIVALAECDAVAELARLAPTPCGNRWNGPSVTGSRKRSQGRKASMGMRHSG